MGVPRTPEPKPGATPYLWGLLGPISGLWTSLWGLGMRRGQGRSCCGICLECGQTGPSAPGLPPSGGCELGVSVLTPSLLIQEAWLLYVLGWPSSRQLKASGRREGARASRGQRPTGVLWVSGHHFRVCK